MCVVNFTPLSFYSPRRNLLPPVPGTRRTRGWVPPGRVWTLWRKQNLDPCLEPNCATLVVQTIAWARTNLRCVPTNRVESSPIRRANTRHSAASLHLLTMVACEYVYTLAESSRVESSRVLLSQKCWRRICSLSSDFSDRAERLLFCVKKWMLQRWLF
jgi:hypothetical protein